MLYNLARKALKSVLPSKVELAMSILFGGKSLGWRKLPNRPGFINGRIFQSQTMSLPWLTYPAIAQLMRWNLSDLVVLEYGSGSSTKFFFEQGARLIVSREDNKEWFEFVNSSIPSSDRFRYALAKEKNEYVLSPSGLCDVKPSIVLIDGSYRADCAKECFEWIKGNSVQDSPALIILDNSDWCGKSYSILASLEGYLSIDFYGHGPFNGYAWCTTFFINKESSAADKIFSSSRAAATPMLNGLLANHSIER